MQSESDELVDADGEPAEPRGPSIWFGLMAVALVILVFGTSQILSMNAERDEQARRVRQAQSQMDVLTAAP